MKLTYDQIYEVVLAELKDVYEDAVNEVKAARRDVKKGDSYRSGDVEDYRRVKKATRVLIKYYSTPDEYAEWQSSLP